jgi:thioredoxin-related protein/Tol biopolymer transport system component
MVEVRILFPTRLISSSYKIIKENKFAEIMKEELGWAKKADHEVPPNISKLDDEAQTGKETTYFLEDSKNYLLVSSGNSLYKVSEDGKEIKQISLGMNGDIEWGLFLSPDGKKILFGFNQSLEFNNYHESWWIMNSDGTGKKDLGIEIGIEDGSDYLPSFSPDGKKILFELEEHVYRPVNTEYLFAWIMNSDGTGKKAITKNLRGLSARRPFIDIPPSFSPDGKKILLGLHFGVTLYRESDRAPISSENSSIWLMDTEGTGEELVREKVGPLRWLSFSPDGKKILFAFESGSYPSYPSIWIMNSDGTEKRKLAEGGDRGLSFSPDGKKIAVFQAYSMDFWLMNSDGTKQINLSKTLGMQINNAIWYPKFKDTTINTVQLSSPSNGTTLPFPPGDITFSWNSVSNATKYEFILYNPRGQVVLDTTINRTSLTVPLAGGEDTITWKVRTSDSSGNWGAWSSLWSLTFKSNITTSGETQTDLIKPKIGYLLIETIPIDCIIEIPLLNIDKEHEGNKTKKTWEVSAISIGNYRINFIALGKEVKYDLKIEEGVQKHLLVNILNNEVKEILPVLTWDRTYGGSGDDVAFSLIQTIDGGYAVAGGTSSQGAGGADFWVIKLDEQGNEIWDRTYGGSGDDVAFSLIQTTDGGYAVAGLIQSKGTSGRDFWVIKLDEQGNQIWDRTYGGGSGDDFEPKPIPLIQTIDGGYAVAGQTESKGASDHDFWVIKLDEEGNIVWDRTYGGSGNDVAFSLIQTTDGSYAVAGYTTSKGAGKEDAWVIKLDEQGNQIWDRTYGGSDADWASSLIQTTDGGYAVAAVAVLTYSKGAGNLDFWVIKLDEQGNKVWDKTYGGNSDDVVFSLIQTTDGGYAIAGGISSKGAGGADAWVIKLDEQGNLKPGVSKLNDEAQTGTEANTTNIQKIPVPSLDSYPQVSENWLNYNEGLALTKKENKYILIYFYTDWCGYCKKMDKETYSKEEVKKILNENFVVVKVNAESDKKVIENGKEITESELSKLYQVSGYPTTWFLESNHSRVAPLPGCVTTEQFISVLNYIGEGWYKSISFQEYLGKI